MDRLHGAVPGERNMPTAYDFDAVTLDGKPVTLQDYLGRVTLVVNTASKCGLTPQYMGLEKVYERYRDRGFAVLGFPCDQFAHQEPGDAAQIAAFCQKNYGVTFPMFSKIDVNGPKTHPLYEFLKQAAPGMLGSTAIKWNFTKFLVDRRGAVRARYAPTTKPEDIAADIESALLE
jgi:glutathione peroxidase